MPAWAVIALVVALALASGATFLLLRRRSAPASQAPAPDPPARPIPDEATKQARVARDEGTVEKWAAEDDPGAALKNLPPLPRKP